MSNIECPVQKKDGESPDLGVWKDISDLAVKNEVSLTDDISVIFRNYTGNITLAQAIAPCGRTIYGSMLTTYSPGGVAEQGVIEQARSHLGEKGYEAACNDCPQNIQ